MTRRQLAESYFMSGYSCAQAVVLAYEDVFNIDKEQLMLIASSFGGGLGRLREVCGAVSGMAMVAGALKGYSTPGDVSRKAEHYALIQRLAARFKDINGSIVCRDLLGAKLAAIDPVPDARTPEYYKSRPCAKLVGDAAQILQEELVSYDLHSMRLANEPFDMMNEGVKTVEIRLFDEKRQGVKEGDVIIFGCGDRRLKVKVVYICRADGFASLFEKRNILSGAGFRGMAAEQAAKSMYKFYSPDEERKYGAVAIGFEKL